MNDLPPALKRRIQDSLVKSIEIILGRVPSREEMAKHLTDEVENETGKLLFKWKGKTLLKVPKPVETPEGNLFWELEERDLEHLEKPPTQEDDPTKEGDKWKEGL